MPAQRPHECVDCSKAFKSVLGLVDHTKDIHLKPITNQVPAKGYPKKRIIQTTKNCKCLLCSTLTRKLQSLLVQTSSPVIHRLTDQLACPRCACRFSLTSTGLQKDATHDVVAKKETKQAAKKVSNP